MNTVNPSRLLLYSAVGKSQVKVRRTCLCLVVVLPIVLACLAGCEKSWPFLSDRYAKIPVDAVKGTPATDPFPPILVSPDFDEPVPMPGPVNTAGGEDSPFITPDGQEFYFFFTPDVRVPVEKQLLDSVTEYGPAILWEETGPSRSG